MAEVLVEGLEPFRKGLRRISKDLGKELGKVNKEVGKEIVKLAEKRAKAMSGRFPSYRSKYFRMRPSANQRSVIVTVRPHAAEEGIRRHPVYGRWQNQSEFRRRVWPSEIAKGQGYLVRPTVEDDSEQIGGIYTDAISDFARKVIGAK